LEVDFQHQLDSRLEQIMDELREQSESDVQQYKQDLEEMYNDKVEHFYKEMHCLYMYVITTDSKA